jgi:hypothetical protein
VGAGKITLITPFPTHIRACTTQQIINKFLSFEKNQQFLLNFGALISNLFLKFLQLVRFLRLFSMNLLQTLKMLLLSGFGKRLQGD